MTSDQVSVNLVSDRSVIDQFRRDGFAAVRGVLDRASVDLVRADLMRLLEEAPEIFKGREINVTSDGLVNSLHNLGGFRWSRYLLDHPTIRDFVGQLLGDEPEDFGSELFAKPSGTGVPVPDHQDDYYWCISDGNALTMWFALARSDEVSGAVYYFRGSHRLGLRDHSPSGVPGSSQRISDWSGVDLNSRELVVLEPGDCVVHHARTIHGSGPNNSGHHRLGLTVRFKSRTSSIDGARKEKYLAELTTQLESRGQE